MSYYKKLNLPSNPFINWPELRNEVTKAESDSASYQRNHGVYKSQGLLTPEIEETFDSIGIKISHIVLFCNRRSFSNEKNRIIHSDLTWDYKNGAWKNFHCGINWEMIGSTNLFSWWDMSKHKAIYPQKPDEDEIANNKFILHGINFDRKLQQGIHEHAVKLDEVIIDRPTLVRTDVPHMTVFKSIGVRVGISLRIDESQLNSWDEIVEKFKPLIVQ